MNRNGALKGAKRGRANRGAGLAGWFTEAGGDSGEKHKKPNAGNAERARPHTRRAKLCKTEVCRSPRTSSRVAGSPTAGNGSYSSRQIRVRMLGIESFNLPSLLRGGPNDFCVKRARNFEQVVTRAKFRRGGATSDVAIYANPCRSGEVATAFKDGEDRIQKWSLGSCKPI